MGLKLCKMCFFLTFVKCKFHTSPTYFFTPHLPLLSFHTSPTSPVLGEVSTPFPRPFPLSRGRDATAPSRRSSLWYCSL